MAEVQTKEGELTAAELATYGIEPKQPDGPKLVKGQVQEILDRAAAVSEPTPLFSESEIGHFRSQWSKVQTGFVDEPRRTVEDADKLVAAVLERLAEGFANERSGLEKQWDSGDNVSTENLRLALTDVRSESYATAYLTNQCQHGLGIVWKMYKSEQCLKHDTGNLWEFELEGGHGLVAGNRRSDPHDRIASLYFRYSRFRPNSPGFGLSCMQL